MTAVIAGDRPLRERLLDEQPELVKAEPIRLCPTCKHPAPDRFCSACGERILVRPDYSFRGFLLETLNVFTNLESNIFRSFSLLVTKPGLLTVEYFKGRRKLYLKPLQLFIFCNVIFFLVQAFTGTNSLRTPLRVHLTLLPHSALARRMVDGAIANTGVSKAQYAARFDAAIETQAKTLVFLMIPLFALGLRLIYLRNKEYFVKHLVFSTHFYSFYLLLLAGIYLLMMLIARVFRVSNDYFNDFSMTTLVLSCVFVYLLFGLRCAYESSWLMSAVRSLGLAAIVMIALQIFRAILFFTTFLTV